jgi:hypothetical protein
MLQLLAARWRMYGGAVAPAILAGTAPRRNRTASQCAIRLCAVVKNNRIILSYQSVAATAQILD